MTELLQSAQGIFTNVLAFVFALGVIIAIHEWGHLVVAKLFDVRVTAFSLGFGPRLWGFRRGETDYRISLVPLGGYVKLGGEQPDEATGDPREFLSKPRWQRIFVYLAGPAMNVLLALLLIAGVFMAGANIPDLSVPPVVGAVVEDSSAAAAGLRAGDLVLAIDGSEVESWDDLAVVLWTTKDRPLALTVERDGETLQATVTPRALPDSDASDGAGLLPTLYPTLITVQPGEPAEAAGIEPMDQVRRVDGRPVASPGAFVDYVSARPGEEIVLAVARGGRVLSIPVTPADVDGVGRIGVSLGVYQQYGFFEAFAQSARYNWGVVTQTFSVLGRIFVRKASARDNLAGPIQIAVISGQAAQRGFKDLLQLMGLISVSIAILNLLPIPILDGGQIAILLVESSMRRDLSFRVKELIAQAGFVIIILLMLTVIYFDLSKTLFN